MYLLTTLDSIIRLCSLLPLDLFAVEVIKHRLHYVRMYYKQTDNQCANKLGNLKYIHLLYTLIHRPEPIASNTYQEGHKCEYEQSDKKRAEVVLVKVDDFFGGGQEAVD